MARKRRNVIWHSKARAEFATILAFFRERNGSNDYSRRLLQGLRRKLEIVRVVPQMGEATGRPDERVMPYENYMVVYRIRPNEIEILAVWDARRDPEASPF